MKIIPLLFAPLEAGDTNLTNAIRVRLRRYETALMKMLLEPFEHALSDAASHQDECEHLYMVMMKMFGDIINSFRAFMTQPAVLDNPHAEVFLNRLVSYVILLQKRREDLFKIVDKPQRKKMETRTQGVISKLRAATQERSKENERLENEIKQLEEELEEKLSLLKKLLKHRERLQSQIEKFQSEINENRSLTYNEVMRILRASPDLTVRLSFESMLNLDNQRQHFAFASGKGGITRLPVVVTLPESKYSLRVRELSKTIGSMLS